MTTEEQILICAVRYALGRQSYIVGVVAEYVNCIKDKLSKECVNVISRDIQEEIEFYHKQGRTCGMECDERTWANLWESLQKHRINEFLKNHDEPVLKDKKYTKFQKNSEKEVE